MQFGEDGVYDYRLPRCAAEKGLTWEEIMERRWESFEEAYPSDGTEVNIEREMQKRDDEHRRESLSTGHCTRGSTTGAEGAFNRLVFAFSESTDKTVAQSEKKLALHKETHEQRLALDERRVALESERLKQGEAAENNNEQHRSRMLEVQREESCQNHTFAMARLEVDRETRAVSGGILTNLTEMLKVWTGGRGPESGGSER